MSDAFTQVIELAFSVLGADDAQKVADVLQGVGAAGDKANSQLGPLISSFEDLAAKAALVQQAIDLQSKLQANQAALDAAKASLAALNAEFDKTDKSSADITIAFQQAQKSVTSLANEQLKLQTASASTTAQLKAAGVDTSNLGAANEKLQASTKDAATQLTAAASAAKQVGEAHEAAATSANKASTAFGFVQDNLKKIISVAAAVELALKGIEFGSESLKSVEDIQASLARVKATAQGTSDDFAGMDEAIQKAADAVNVSSGDAAKGLAALAASGLNAQGAVQALVPTLQLAKIAQIDVGAAANIVGEALKSFNLPASDAQKVVDELTVASKGAAGGLTAMSEAASKLAPNAKAIGLTFEQTLSILGLLASKGIDTSKSFNGLATIFQDLKNPLSDLRGQLAALGDNSDDFGAAIAALTSGTPRANQALLTLTGTSRTLVQALGQAGPEALAKFSAGLNASAGAADTFIKKLDDSVNGALTRFRNALGDVGEDLAKPILGPLQTELETLAAKLKALTQTDDFKTFEDQIGELASNAFKALNGLIDGIHWDTFADDIVKAAIKIGDTAKEVADNIGTVASGINKLADVIGIVFNAISSPLNTAAALVTVACAGITLAIGVVVEAFENMVGSSTKTGEAIIAFGNKLVATSAGFAKAAGDNINQVSKDIADLAPTADDAAKKIAASFGNVQHSITSAAGDSQKFLLDFSNVASVAKTVAVSFDNVKSSASSMSTAAFNALGTMQTAAKNLGIMLQQDLIAKRDDLLKFFNDIDQNAAKTAAGLADRQTAFLAYAKAAIAAAANMDDATKESVRIDLETRASKLGVTDALKSLEGGFKGVADQVVITTGRIADNAGEMEIAAQKAQKYADAMAVLRDTSASLGDKMKAAADAITNAGDSTEKQAAVAESARASIEAEAGAASSLAQVLANVQAGFNAVSQAAGANFSDAMSRALQNIGLTKEAVSDLSDSFGKLNAASSDTSGFVAYFNALTSAAAETQKQIDAQKATVNEQTAAFNNFATSSSASLDQLVSKLGVTQASLAAMDEQLKAGTYNAGLLGQQDLAGLQQAVDATIAKVQALKDATKAASDQFDSLAQSVHDELLQQLGDQAALENERDANTLAQLLALKQAGQVSDAQYQKALADEQQLHALKMADIAAQAAAQKSSSASGGSGASDSGSGTDSGAGASGGGGLNPRGQLPASPSVASQPATVTHTYYVTMQNSVLPNTPAMTQFARDLQKELNSIAARSR